MRGTSRLAASVFACGALGFAGCHAFPGHNDLGSQSYGIEVRCHTAAGVPIPNVKISNPESGASAFSDSAGIVRFLLDGLEGSEATISVDTLPDGIALLDESGPIKLTLKSLTVPSATGTVRRPLIQDIVMRRNRETYVVLVAAEGVPNQSVRANGIEVGRLNSRGAGAFRIDGQPGEELKIAILASERVLGTGGLQKTFTLPPTGAVLSYLTNVHLLAESVDNEPPPTIVQFSERPHRRHHSSRNRRTKEAPVVLEKAKGPVQVPFRDIDLQKR